MSALSFVRGTLSLCATGYALVSARADAEVEIFSLFSADLTTEPCSRFELFLAADNPENPEEDGYVGALDASLSGFAEAGLSLDAFVPVGKPVGLAGINAVRLKTNTSVAPALRRASLTGARTKTSDELPKLKGRFIAIPEPSRRAFVLERARPALTERDEVEFGEARDFETAVITTTRFPRVSDFVGWSLTGAAGALEVTFVSETSMLVYEVNELKGLFGKPGPIRPIRLSARSAEKRSRHVIETRIAPVNEAPIAGATE